MTVPSGTMPSGARNIHSCLECGKLFSSEGRFNLHLHMTGHKSEAVRKPDKEQS